MLASNQYKQLGIALFEKFQRQIVNNKSYEK